MTHVPSGSSIRRRPMTPGIPFLLAIAAVGLAGTTDLASQQVPSFRSEVEYVAVDVQVVDREGRPLPELAADKFEVSINGKRRKVVTADFIRNAELTTNSLEPKGLVASNGAPMMRSGSGRVFMVAIDENSLAVGTSRGIIEAVEGFIKQLQPGDLVGLYSYPLGPKIQPTTDHAALIRRLGDVVGNKRSTRSEFHLTPTEVIDITSLSARSSNTEFGAVAGTPAVQVTDDGDTLRRVQLRECGMSDVRCIENIQQEALAMAFDYENQVTQSLFGLRNLVLGLSSYPGRKTVVVLSGGMVVSDRPGGRPDVGELPKVLGQEAAQSNIAIYALYMDTTFLELVSAQTAKTDFMPPSSGGRDSAILDRLMVDFSAASGGAFMPVTVGSGEYALGRVLRETSAHYLLAVEPADADRDGKLRELRVKVNHSGATTRSRSWVVIPKRG